MKAGDLQAMLRRIEAIPVPTGSVAPVTWFLDIDGVMNVIGQRPGSGWPSYLRAGVMMDGFMWPVVYAPALITVMNRLHDRGLVSYRWLTTWEYEGPERFAPAVGLRVGDWVAAVDDGTSNTWWKLEAIVEHLVDAPQLFIWTDDDIKHFHAARQVVDHLEPQHALVLCTDEKLGLTPENIDSIISAIELALG